MKNRIPEQTEICVFVTKGGEICIEQWSERDGELVNVLVSPESVGRLCKLLKALKSEAADARQERWAAEDGEGA